MDIRECMGESGLKNVRFIIGEDIILYLPNNEVDLHGNLSSDDHKIVGWEWTRAPTQPGEDESHCAVSLGPSS